MNWYLQNGKESDVILVQEYVYQEILRESNLHLNVMMRILKKFII